MDSLYRARLTRDPPIIRASSPLPPRTMADSSPPVNDIIFNVQPPSHDHSNNDRQPNQPAPGAIPIQLPNIYVNPYPVPEPSPAPPAAPPAAPTARAVNRLSQVRLGNVRMTRPHPLLWVSLVISIFALVLGVPKGSLPTLTGRHKELRTQERLIQEKLQLLTQLSTFLPPPLQPLVMPLDPNKPSTPSSYLSLYNPLHPLTCASGKYYNSANEVDGDLCRLSSGLKFWNTAWGGNERDGGRWWSVEDLGKGASVVRSKGDGEEREVWVLRMGETESDTLPLQTALTHSLYLRDKLQSELASIQAGTCRTTSTSNPHPPALHINGQTPVYEVEENEALHEEWERMEEKRRIRERERERAVEEREKEVARREKWVVEEMKKLSEKVHAQATELTLEDRITERLKSYQRQLAHLNAERQEA